MEEDKEGLTSFQLNKIKEATIELTQPELYKRLKRATYHKKDKFKREIERYYDEITTAKFANHTLRALKMELEKVAERHPYKFNLRRVFKSSPGDELKDTIHKAIDLLESTTRKKKNYEFDVSRF